MKKLLVLFLTILFGLSLSACDPSNNIDNEQNPPTEFNFIDIYYLNDFHGALESSSDSIGITRIANYLEVQKTLHPDNTIILAGGDMLQGSALSNYYYGLSTITLMNDIQFDAFVLGNHEFDWGIDVILDYIDGDEENGEADFPLLGANVFYEGTETMLDNVEPYTIIDVYDMKIGIIGTMGYGLETSIATSRIADYDFASPVPIIADYASLLRNTYDCDMVVWVGHDSGAINDSVSELTGDSKIDAIFNGHSHIEYANMYLGVPQLQAGANGEFLGHVRIYFDTYGDITDYVVENLESTDSLDFQTEDSSVSVILNGYVTETSSLFNTPIIDSEESYYSRDLSRWIAKLMRIASDSDIAFQNYGGTRSDLDADETITLGKLYEIWPFDNYVKTVELPGSEVKSLISNSGDAYDTDIEVFLDDVYYTVATNDYIFDKEYNPFIDGTNIVNTGLVLRDLAADEFILQSLVYDTFNVDNLIQTEPQN